MATINTPTGSVSGSAQEIIVTAAAGVAVVVVLYWLVKSEIKGGLNDLADTASEVADTVKKGMDITDSSNWAYRGASALSALMAGDPNHTVSDDVEEVAKIFKKDLNPTSSENVVQKAGDFIVRAVTGNDKETLSGQIGDSIDWLKSVW